MRTVRRWIAGFAAAAAFVALVSVAAWAQSCPPQCPSGEVRLGIAVPTSGPPAGIGAPTLKAAEAAIQDLNASGGLLGVPVKLAVGDDRCDAGMAARVAKHHIEQDKINFLIGPLCPGVALDAAPIYAKAGVIQFVPAVTVVELTRRNPNNIFRIAANDEQEAQALGAWLARDQQQGKKVAVVYDDVFYRRAMAEQIKLALPDAAKALTRFEPLMEVPGATDRLAAKLQREPVDIIYLALGGAQVVEFVSALRARDVKSMLLGGQQLLSQGFWRATGRTTEGLHVLAPIASLSSPEFRDAIDRLKQASIAPDLVALYSYVAVQVWAEAVRRAGSGDPKKVVEVLRSSEFTTPVGRIAFDQKGDRRDISYSFLTWQGGPLTELRLVQ
jgi:branched-chain amino acid transport system substrate-binding protein